MLCLVRGKSYGVWHLKSSVSDAIKPAVSRRCSLPSNGAVLHRINILQGQEAYAAAEAADIVLLNVAAHAAEALSEQPTIRRARRAALPSLPQVAGTG